MTTEVGITNYGPYVICIKATGDQPVFLNQNEAHKLHIWADKAITIIEPQPASNNKEAFTLPPETK